ncbi:MAG: hypothetical protein IGR76_18190 [Synechococcales cyanobacterium T60_A2020_003]|nr:hypothetical protein [Synechococcales cyanobacterium T60_A2020_003]
MQTGRLTQSGLLEQPPVLSIHRCRVELTSRHPKFVTPMPEYPGFSDRSSIKLAKVGSFQPRTVHPTPRTGDRHPSQGF